MLVRNLTLKPAAKGERMGALATSTGTATTTLADGVRQQPYEQRLRFDLRRNLVNLFSQLRVIDARYFQIAVVGTILLYAAFILGQPIRLSNALAFFCTCLGSEYFFAAMRRRSFDPLSPIITAISLTLLLRTNDLTLALLAGPLAIGAKYLLRVKDKHIFNPSNIAIVALTLSGQGAWVSTGQWGQTAFIAFALASLGCLVCTRAQRLDLAIAFLLSWTMLLFGRALYLGDPLAIPLHQLQDGTLLIFAFFMITDPRATPDHRLARVVFAVLVAMCAYFWRFFLYEPNALLLALACGSPLTLLLDLWFKEQRFRW